MQEAASGPPMPTSYSARITEQFLETRAQLGAALFSLTALAEESLATQPAAARLRAVQAHLRRPFVFLAVGEASAEKSSLLNALFGRDFSDPDERHTSIFKYGDHVSDTALTSSVVERCRPLPFLRDFQLVAAASPGTILSDHEARIEELAPGADLILFVVSIRDPWNESAWDLIQSVVRKWSKPLVIAVQHADERAPREVDAICRHLERTAFARLGGDCPVFPVSAREALLARTSGQDRDRLWRESGFGPLEARINEIVGGALGRGSDLPAAAGAGRAVLAGIAADIRRLVQDVSDERAAIAAADGTIAEAEAGCEAVVDGLRGRLEAAAARCRKQGVNLLQVHVRGSRKLGLTGGRGTRRWARAFHRNLAGLLRAAVDREVELALNAMIAHFQAAADRLLAACDQPTEAVGVDCYGQAAKEVGALCRQLAVEVEMTLAEHLAQDTVDARVQSLLAKTANQIRAAAAFALGGVLFAPAVGSIFSPGVGLMTAVIGLAIGAGAGASAQRQGQAAVRCYQQETPALHTALIAAVETACRISASGCCSQLRRALAPLSEHCARRDGHVRPMRDQVEGLETVFRQIAGRS